MNTRTIKPSRKYRTKLQVVCVLSAGLIMLGMTLVAWALSYAPKIGADGAGTIIAVTAAANIIWLVPALILADPYYRSLHYEVQDDEVIVRAGIVTKSVKHVPYRTVTNITIKRGLLDRWLFGLGTLNIQTAGMSGTTGAEESLVGLDNVQDVYDAVVMELRRFRGCMAPTAAGSDEALTGKAHDETTDALVAILSEIQAIRRTVEQS
jgi:membrane protein YdbS with pleckstrin-like domain